MSDRGRQIGVVAVVAFVAGWLASSASGGRVTIASGNWTGSVAGSPWPAAIFVGLVGGAALLVALASVFVSWADRVESEREAREARMRPWRDLERRRIFDRVFEETPFE
jgi:hypothetical protein